MQSKNRTKGANKSESEQENAQKAEEKQNHVIIKRKKV